MTPQQQQALNITAEAVARAEQMGLSESDTALTLCLTNPAAQDPRDDHPVETIAFTLAQVRLERDRLAQRANAANN